MNVVYDHIEEALKSARVGYKYHVEIRGQHPWPGQVFQGTLRSKKVVLRGETYWWFETRNVHTLVDQGDIVELKRILEFP